MGRRWGADAPSGAEEARTRLVDAAEACIERCGLAKTTVEDVAAEAQVSRATIYRYFANRDELLLSALVRELGRSLDRTYESFLRDRTTPTELAAGLVESASYLLGVIRTTPKLHDLLATEAPGLSATISGAAPALFRAYTRDLAPHLRAAQQRGLLRDDLPAEWVAEWLLRAILSMLTVDGPKLRTADEERALLEAFLLPALVPPKQPAAG